MTENEPEFFYFYFFPESNTQTSTENQNWFPSVCVERHCLCSSENQTDTNRKGIGSFVLDVSTSFPTTKKPRAVGMFVNPISA